MTPKQLGLAIIVLSMVTLALLISFKVVFDQHQLDACAQSCDDEGSASCTMASCPYAKGGLLSWIPLIASIFVAGLGGLGAYLFLSKEEKVLKQKTYDLTGLSKDEQDLFDVIKKSEQGVYQNVLCKQLDISRVKATRMLDKLEKRDLIERRRRGMTNVIFVK